MNIDKSKLSALIIGVGSIGERHLRCFQASGLYTVAGCDRNIELGGNIADQYHCPVYPSLEDAFAAGRFDVAVVCTLANSHIPIAAACVQRGLHVFIEKPLALSLEGIADLSGQAEAERRLLRVAYTTRSMKPVIALKEIVSSGEIGRPRHISCVSGQHFPTYRPAYREIYYNSHETGGGAIQDALTHQLHTVEWIAGPIRRVFASAAHQVLEGVEVEDTVNLNAVLDDGTLASFAFNQFQAPNETVIQVNGSKGSARMEMHNQRVGVMHYGDAEWTWNQQSPEERDASYIRQAVYFARELDGCSTPLATLQEGLQTLKVNRAALESARTHCEVIVE